MDAKECIKRIIHVLGEQRYVFSKGLQLYCSNLDSLKQIEEKFVDPLNLNCFQGDMYSISQDLPDIVLYPWSYKAPRPTVCCGHNDDFGFKPMRYNCNTQSF